MKKRTSVRSLARAVRAEHNRRRQTARAKARAERKAQHFIQKAFKHPPYKRWYRLYNPFSKRWLRFPLKETADEVKLRLSLEEHFAEVSRKHKAKRFGLDKEAA
jgi:hypothetical protein